MQQRHPRRGAHSERRHDVTSRQRPSAAVVAVELNRARQLVSVGKTLKAIGHLKSAVRAHPDATPLRLTLAGLYRELGYPDQAGRWGIAIDGWTSALERDRLARLLASSGVARHDVTRFLALPAKDLADVPVIAALFDGPVATYREQHGYDDVVRANALSSCFSTIAGAGWASSLTVIVLWIVWGAFDEFMALGDPYGLTRIVGWLCVSLVGFSLLMNAVAAAAERRATWATGVGATGLLLIGLSLDRLLV